MAACCTRKSAQMHMGRFGAGLADAAVRHGARIYEDAPVTGLSAWAQAAAHRVTTPRGTVTAKQVLVATGPSRRGPFCYFRRRIVPVGSFIIATEPLSPAQVDADHADPAQRHHDQEHRQLFPHHARQPADLRRPRALRPVQPDLRPQERPHPARPGCRRRSRSSATCRIDYCWGGVVDLTADRLPRAGEHDGLFYAMGYSGHGAQMSVHMGQQMAAVMAGMRRPTRCAACPGPPCPAISARPGSCRSWALYYRIKDRMSGQLSRRDR